MQYTAQQKLEAIQREVHFRLRVYARRIELGKMTREKATYEYKVMRAIEDDYRALAEKERLI